MSDIATKLTYLNGTKSQLKDMINYGLPTENKITNETTFRNYVKGIFEAFIESLRDSSTLYTNLPKISGNGTQITLNDTANAPMRITLKASELSQDATPTPDSPQDIHTISGDNSVVVEGKNLISKANYYSQTNKYYSLVSANYNVVNGEYYAISVDTPNNPSIEIYINLGTATLLTRISGNYNLPLDGTRKTWIVRANATGSPTGVSLFARYSDTSTTATGLLSNIMIEHIASASDTSTSYEPYVSQTAQLNLGEVENLINISTLSNGYVNGAGGITSSTSNEERVSPFIKVKPNTAYTFKIFKSSWSGATNDNWIGIGEYSSNDTSTFIQRDTMTTGTQNYITFTTTATTQYVMISARGLLEATEIQFSEDTLWTNKNLYTPYGTTPIELGIMPNTNYSNEFVRSDGKNLFDKDGNITTGKIYNSSGNQEASSADDFCLNDYINVLPNTQYTISGSTYLRVCEYKSDKTFIIRSVTSGNDSSATFTTTSNTYYVRISALISKINSIQLEKGNQATDYVPYEKGWYYKQGIGKVVLDGSEINWGIRTGTSSNTYFENSWSEVLTNNTSLSNELSNYFKIGNPYNTIGGLFWLFKSNNITILRMGMTDTSINTLEAFKTWLGTNKPVIYYPMATPTYTQITGTLETQLNNIYKNMLSYKGTTNVSQINNDLPFVLGVSAIEDL